MRSQLFFQPNDKPTLALAAVLREVRLHDCNSLTEIDDALQEHFFPKKDGKPLERWELPTLSLEDSPLLRHALEDLGLVQATAAQHPSYCYAGWIGATLPAVRKRLFDLVCEWNRGVRWNALILLGSARPFGSVPGENLKDLCDSAKSPLGFREDWKPGNTPISECGMMRTVLYQCQLPPMMAVNMIEVEAPMVRLYESDGSPIFDPDTQRTKTRRPDTEDVFRAWFAKNPTPGTMLLSSYAPYGPAQDVAAWMIGGPRGFTFETIGQGADPQLTLERYMREIAVTVHRIRRSRGL